MHLGSLVMKHKISWIKKFLYKINSFLRLVFRNFGYLSSNLNHFSHRIKEHSTKLFKMNDLNQIVSFRFFVCFKLIH
jgi:hypothetical protein